MSAYQLEYSANSGVSWGVVSKVPHPNPCTSPITYQDGRYLSPGKKLFRVFAEADNGGVSGPSESFELTIPIPPIGNPGGQTEYPLPPSPYQTVPVPPIGAPDPSTTLRNAIQAGLETCLGRKLAHTACMKALAEALGKVNE